MSEEAQLPEAGSEPANLGADPAAMALALSGASQEKADAFLEDQRRLIANQLLYLSEQRHHLHRQYTQLDLGIWQQRLSVLLRVATAFVGIAAAAALAFLVWDASRSNGLVVEPFSVPPDLAQRGMTGEVLAARLLDQLVTLQAQTTSSRASKSYTSSWAEGAIKLDIPETGVSLAEIDRFLRGRLGHDIHVTGEIVRIPSGLSLTVRAGLEGADSAAGADSELDALIQKSAESIYRMTQPFRYGLYLSLHGRDIEAAEVQQALARTGPLAERPWGYYGLASLAADLRDNDEGFALLRHALDLAPDNILFWASVAQTEDEMSRPEQALRDERQALVLLQAGNPAATVRADFVPYLIKVEKAGIDLHMGAFRESSKELADVIRSDLTGRYAQRGALARTEVGEHDLSAARLTMSEGEEHGVTYRVAGLLYGIRASMLIDSEAQDWAHVISHVKDLAPVLKRYPGARSVMLTLTTPLVAYAEAKTGNIATAEAEVARTPANCYLCLRTRARIAELRGEHNRADWWFARAQAIAPSIPFAYADWGSALLARSQPDAAIAQFTIANRKGPHFADALEGWGEALMAKNQSHKALEKFAEAEKYAPNWGRLHLKWGEALAYAGRREEAAKQFARAAQIDLTPGEKTELASVNRMGNAQ